MNKRGQLLTDQISVVARYPPNHNHKRAYTYAGTFGSDQALRALKKGTLQEPWGMIFNIDPISKPGQHWIALYGDRGQIDIMDSYGSEGLDAYPQPHVRQILDLVDVTPMRRIQSYDTYVCGHYCLTYLHVRTKGLSLTDFLKAFSNPNTRENDRTVCRFMCKVLVPRPLRLKFRKTVGRIGQACQSNCCKNEQDK